MCFSATASFVAGGALAATGGITLAQAKTKEELPLASVPLFFGIQQTIEGVIWISLGQPVLNTVMTYAYLMFAYVWWPIFVPIVFLLIETNPVRKSILKILSVLGFVIGMYLLYFVFADPGKAHIVNQSIAYDYRHLHKLLPLTLYVVVTCGSGLVSSHKTVNVFAMTAFASFLFTYWFFNTTFISVWCFFAAVLSVVIYAYFRGRQNVAEAL